MERHANKNQIQSGKRIKFDLILPLNGFLTLILLTTLYEIARKELAKQDLILEKEKMEYKMFLDSVNTQKQDSSIITLKELQQNTK